MKILYYFACEESMMFEWQKMHIVDEMKHHHCEIEIFNPLIYESLDKANEAVVKEIRDKKYDCFMSCHNGTVLYVETIKRIKEAGIPTLNFRPDNLVIPFFDKESAKHYDLVWITSKETEYLYKKWGCNTIFLPYAANPYAFKPVKADHQINKIVFIGNPHGSRIGTLNYLTNHDVPLTVHTRKTDTTHKLINASASDYAKIVFKNNLRYPIGIRLTAGSIKEKFGDQELVSDGKMIEIKEPIALSDLAEVYGTYALSLAFTDANSTGCLKKPVKIVNLRNFEIPMVGGLEITSYCPEIAEYFDDDKEIVLARTRDELVDKAHFYLKPEMEPVRNRMKENARKRAESDHTWYNRFSKAFEKMGIKALDY